MKTKFPVNSKKLFNDADIMDEYEKINLSIDDAY
jgi:hypothetical protein